VNRFPRRLRPLLLLLILVAGLGLFWYSQRSPAAAAKPVYVALGASDTVGIGADQPESDAWVPLVDAALPQQPDLLNLGINGATVGDVLQQELPVALDARPSWITLWPGVNDIRHGVDLPTFTQQLNQVLTRLQATNAHVVVLTIPDLRLIPAFSGQNPDQLDATVHQWNAVITQAAQSHGAILVDLYDDAPELAAHPEYISGDGFHPSSAGYRRIADLVLKEIHSHVPSSR
jgi:lysophospholipase L1-like esterase